MTHQDFITKAVDRYALENGLRQSEVFIVWSCKAAQNSKLLIANSRDEFICEVTMVGSGNVINFDYYQKCNTIAVAVEDL